MSIVFPFVQTVHLAHKAVLIPSLSSVCITRSHQKVVYSNHKTKDLIIISAGPINAHCRQQFISLKWPPTIHHAAVILYWSGRVHKTGAVSFCNRDCIIWCHEFFIENIMHTIFDPWDEMQHEEKYRLDDMNYCWTYFL